jgi:hypothetical protein
MSAEIEQGKAIEVATMLGDSVVDVKHCMDPHSGKISSKTWALLAAGALCVLVSAVAFYVSVSAAAYNQGALDYWTHVAHKPAYAYRAKTLGFGYDWLAFGGFVVGLVTIAGAMLRMRDERKSPYYRIGTAPGVEQPVEGAPTPDFPLVAPHGDEFVFNFARNIDGEAIIDGKARPLAELVASGHARPSTTLPGTFELPLALHPRIRAKLGQTQFLVSSVGRPRRHATPLFTGLQSRTMAYFAGSLGAHLGLVLLLSYIPVEGSGATFDVGVTEMVSIKSDSKTSEDVPPEQQEALDTGGAGPEGAGAAMTLEAGQAGDPSKPQNATSHIRIKNKEIDPQLARIQAIEEARSAGILGSLSPAEGDKFASITELGNLSSGPDAFDAYGAIFGADGEGYGTFGYSRTGFGKGGGCVGGPCGIIGTQPGYGRIGLGRFPGSGWDGPGGGIIGTRTHRPDVPKPVIGTPTTVGDLDKEIIRRYIKRNFAKITYCYEKELLVNNTLTGTINVQFFISPTGSVTTAAGNGANQKVANCIADVIQTIEFPRPSGGAGVQVNYPFTIKTAGQ